MAAVEHMQRRVAMASPRARRAGAASRGRAPRPAMAVRCRAGLGVANATGSRARDRRATVVLPAGRPTSSTCSHGHQLPRRVKEKMLEFFQHF
jgi:hypothetical protein